MNPTDHHEVERLIMQLDNEKAPGIDGLDNRLIKSVKDSIVTPLTLICNLSLSSGLFPDEWKMASVCPIFKCGSRDKPENYRPISLLGAFSKILEKIVNKRLVDFLEKQNVLSARQLGFRRGKSTEDAVRYLTTSVAACLDEKENCIGVFLDLAKAFDTVSVPLLLKKLNDSGVRGLALEWFASYLMGRKQCVSVGQFRSSSQEVRYGVPQGSILGPTLFILYMNDLHKIHIESAEVVCYADDTAIVFRGSTWKDAFANAESGLAQVSHWLQRNLLTLNATKTKFLCFHKT
jgi:hypothetical protein